MKVKIRKVKHTGETHVEYYNVANKASYRYEMLSRIIRGKPDITIVADTNQRINDLPVDEAESLFKQLNIKYAVMPTEVNKTRYFGLPVDLVFKNKQKTKEYIIALHISPEQFTRELFESFLQNYDFAIGIESKKPFEEVCESLRMDAGEVLFNRSFFEESLYDSILCSSMRCSFDAEKYA
jgi:hypothetical protein